MANTKQLTITADSTLSVNGNDNLVFDFGQVRSQLSTAEADEFWNNVKSDGGDLRLFHDSTGVAIDLQNFDSTAEEGQMYFDSSDHAASTATEWTLEFGDGTLSQPATTDPLGRNAVWTNYEGVWHLEEDPSGTAPQMVDATGNGYDASSNGTMTTADLVSGIIGNALDFDGSDDYLSFSPNITVGDGMSMVLWGNFGGGSDYLGATGGGDFIRYAPVLGALRVRPSITSSIDFDFSLSNGNDYHITHTKEATNSWRAYLNGSASSSNPLTGGDIDIGLIGWGKTDDTFYTNGLLDEVRIANFLMSANWITEEYNNQSNQSGFWSVSDVSDIGGGATYTLTAEQGSYSVTGQTTGLLRTLRLISEQGSYTYTGQTANLLKTYLLAAEQGSYSIVGADGELLETFILEAESGNYTLTGQETQFLRTLKLIAGQGTYSLSGQTTNLLRNLLLTAEQGSYSLLGQDAIISAVSNYILTAESGSYSLTGNDTAFLRKLILEAGSGNYTLSGQQTQLLRKLLLSAASGNYTLTGEDIALTVEDSPEILILMSAIVSSLELDSTITTELDLDSSV